MPQFLASQTYGTSVNLVSPALTGTPTAPTAAAGTNTTQVATTAFVQAALQMDHALCQGRLTLTSGNPIGTDTTGTTLYFTPSNGNALGLYDGSTTWNVLSFPEKSIAIPGTTGVYDVFAYNNSGVVALEWSAAWSSTGFATGAAGVRTQALTTQDGVLVKGGATTRRYLGTIYSGSGTGSDLPATRYVWNQSNRTLKKLYSNQTSNWTYAGSTWRIVNNNASGLSQVACIVGGTAKENVIDLRGSLHTLISAVGASAATGLSYDSSTSPIQDLGFFPQAPATSILVPLYATLIHTPDIGWHVYYWMEITNGTSSTFYSTGQGGQGASCVLGLCWC